MKRIDLQKIRSAGNYIIPILLLLLALAWIYQDGGLVFPALRPALQSETHDLNNNGIPEEYILEAWRFRIVEKDLVIWESPVDWQVTAFTLGDANHNGNKELLLVVWKRGSYGEDVPFWITEDDENMRCHLFMFHLTGAKLKALWMSSALHRPINTLQITDINEDGRNELIVQEGSYSFLSKLINPDNSSPSLWQWHSWGFYRLDDS